MRILALALLIAALAGPSAVAAESNIRDLVFETRGLALKTETLVLATEDLVRVTQTTQETRIALPADVLFDFDKANIRPDAAAALAEAARLIREQAKGTVRIEGHTDAKGAADYNQGLSERRAAAVKSWLMDKEGLATTSFATKGFGATQPAASNTTPDGLDDPYGRQQNRRVEIVFGKR